MNNIRNTYSTNNDHYINYSGKNNLETRLKSKLQLFYTVLPIGSIIILLIVLIIALLGYHPEDSGWSNTGKHEQYYNYLSKYGAWSADVLFYLFGRSVWVLMGVLLIKSIQKLNFKYHTYINTGFNHSLHQPYTVSFTRFFRKQFLCDCAYLILWVLISCTIEALRLNHIGGFLPIGAGGIIGLYLGRWIQFFILEPWAVICCTLLWLILAASNLGTNCLIIVDKIGALWDEFQSNQADKEEMKHNIVLGQALEQQRNAEINQLHESFSPTSIQIHVDYPAMISPHTPNTASKNSIPIEPVFKPISLVKSPLITVLPDTAIKATVQQNISPDKLFYSSNQAIQVNSVDHTDTPLNTFTVLNDTLPIPTVSTISTVNIPATSLSKHQLIEAVSIESTVYTLPALSLLDKPEAVTEFVARDTLEYTCRLIEKKLRDYNVMVKVVAAQPGPVITRYEVEPAEGVKGSQIVVLARDLARSLSLTSIRVVETIPGKTTMGLELPNPRRQTVRLSEILASTEYVMNTAPLTMALGKDITGEPVVMDLAKMPHLLVAGTTGSGKSVGINAMILSLLYKSTAEQVRLILIDPKMLELSVYEGIPHLLAPVVTDMKQASYAVNWCVSEMERRYKLMSRLGVRGIAGFNEKIAIARAAGEFISNPFSLTPDEPEPLKPFTYIVLVVDELADLLMVVGKKIEEPLARLAQKSRACGIHLILATQRPSADVLTGLIRSNVPARIAFQVSSKTDSRIILDQMGADALLGNGDMLYLPKGSIPVRVHGAFVSDEEVVRVANMLRELGAPNYVEGILNGEDDEENPDLLSNDIDSEQDILYDKAVEIVLSTKKASISNVQRQLRVGYQRAARMIDAMENAGLISAPEHNGNRTVLVNHKSIG